MVKVNSALILYFTAFVIYIIAVLIDSDNLELFSKPIIIPSIYYYYYISVRGKVNYLFSFSILSFFIGEILHLISRVDFNISGLIFLLIPYFIILHFIIQDLIYYLKKQKIKLNTFSFYIILMLLVYLFFNVLMMMIEESSFDFFIYALYGIMLLLMGVLAFVMQINYTNRTILYTGIMVACFIVSDLFFVFYKKLPDLIALKMINVVTQELSFFCYISYFIYRTKFKLYGKRDIQD
ncbi:hypothetical protein [Flavobacterium cheniae]|uniref:YhhN-like protein n=1 Tax=Flavobacterium cheniae TaxID=295428 RepID=A0A562KJQ0_9FLAO|nr:hypothetical protein [Flavobacterium cheniae]TDR26005.1 hypothetical protein C8D80_0796 [Flavobacterium cheniae]TWH95611.1 hypothetical protein IP97_01289 [Flavobacterium cheniae]